MHPRALIYESMDQWRRFFTDLICLVPKAEVALLDGATIAWAGVAMPLFNHAILDTPVTDLTDFDRRLALVLEFAEARKRAPVISMFHEWLPHHLAGSLAGILEPRGWRKEMNAFGMVMETLPALVTIPGLEIRRIQDAATARMSADINAAAYGVPAEWEREVFDHQDVWHGSVYGYVGLMDGEHVSTALAILLDGRLYVACVATMPEHQRRGYADAVIRHALAEAASETGVTRSILHASDAGLSVYQRMGYRAVGHATAWQWTG